ncbi:hypothetical protein PQU92_17970 [Asticcacaulis sp. BYS171W]|uniref:Uncharacterized protein n=1 Tax=Asticcacaulis aquaticus TaxID=2984212 RepID=A0ABT5HZB3_9CAUL|nr:hypothetical protein [Asticcacaulis aquaticus]MDC7685175.1 hypothetical protein [Asticcacaulis aquaticus]
MYKGNFDCIAEGLAKGWIALDGSTDPVEVLLIVDKKIKDKKIAKEFRIDLLEAGINQGYHAFSLIIPDECYDNGEHLFEIAVMKSKKQLTIFSLKESLSEHDRVDALERQYIELKSKDLNEEIQAFDLLQYRNLKKRTIKQANKSKPG